MIRKSRQSTAKIRFLALPVVDQEYRLVGIVTFDDAMDVLQEENTEDIEMMAAITPTGKPYLKTSTTELWKKKCPGSFADGICYLHRKRLFKHMKALWQHR